MCTRRNRWQGLQEPPPGQMEEATQNDGAEHTSSPQSKTSVPATNLRPTTIHIQMKSPEIVYAIYHMQEKKGCREKKAVYYGESTRMRLKVLQKKRAPERKKIPHRIWQTKILF